MKIEGKSRNPFVSCNIQGFRIMNKKCRKCKLKNLLYFTIFSRIRICDIKCKKHSCCIILKQCYSMKLRRKHWCVIIDICDTHCQMTEIIMIWIGIFYFDGQIEQSLLGVLIIKILREIGKKKKKKKRYIFQ